MRYFDAQNAPIDLNLLPLFVVVADTQSFAQAAKRLHVERSSVSRGVAALERALGVQLFSRTTRKVALTTAGTALYAKVGPQLASLTTALGALPEREQEPSGLLRVTATTDVGALILPAVITGFSLRYPDVSFALKLTSAKVDLVAEGIDVALRVGIKKLADSSLVARKLGDFVIELYASPSYLARTGALRTLSDLASHRLLTPNPAIVLGATPHAQSRTVYADDTLFLRNAAEAGMGIALLPTFAARESVAAGKLVRVLEKVKLESGALFFVHPPASHVPRKVTAFREHLVNYLASNPLST